MNCCVNTNRHQLLTGLPVPRLLVIRPVVLPFTVPLQTPLNSSYGSSLRLENGESLVVPIFTRYGVTRVGVRWYDENSTNQSRYFSADDVKNQYL